MANTLDRAKEMLPAIILTVLSMIQALALELFWSRIVESPYLWQGGAVALVSWVQAVSVFTGILLIWLVHVSFMLRFTWLPSLEDMVIPFFIGILEFGMIELLHPGMVGPWLLLFATVFLVSVVGSHLTMRRARQEPENAYYFEHAPPPSWRDYRHSMTVIATLGILGACLCLYPHSEALALSASLFALLALAYQLRHMRRQWLHSWDRAASTGE